jgi:hypothetical protein
MSQIILQTLDFSTLGIPNSGEFYLGVDVDGVPKLKRSTDTIELYATFSNIQSYYPVSFSQFETLISTSDLSPGNLYLITNFQTRHYIQYTDTNGDGTSNDEVVNIGSVEPLLVLAISTNQYDENVISTSFPSDEIKWRHNLSDREYDYANNPSGVGRGHIIYRKSERGNSRDYDFRNVVFWRWNDGSGNYTVFRRIDAPNQFDYRVFKSFEEGFLTVSRTEVSSILEVPNSYSYPYYLDNLIISTYSNSVNNKIDLALSGFIQSANFENNHIKILENSLFEVGDFFSNDIQYVKDSILSTFSYNNGSLIEDSQILISEFNNFSSIIRSTFSYFVNNSINSVSDIIVTTYSNNISPIREGQTEIIGFESGGVIFSSDLEFNPLLGTFARVMQTNSDFVYTTSSSYLTSTASAGFELYLGLGTDNPLKKLHVKNSGILISGSQSEQEVGLGSSYSARFIIDTESSLTEELIDLRNDSGEIMKVTTTMSSFQYSSQELIIDSTQININGQLTVSTFSLDSSLDKFLVWNSTTGTVSYRLDAKIVNDVATSSYTPTFNNGSNEYFGVSWSSTTYFNLPDLTTVVNGKTIVIKDESGLASVNPIVIQAGTYSIDGVTQSTLSIDYGSLTILKKSNGWWII